MREEKKLLGRDVARAVEQVLSSDDPKPTGIKGHELRGQSVFGKWDPESRQIVLAERTESEPLRILLTHRRGGKTEGEKLHLVFIGMNPSKAAYFSGNHKHSIDGGEFPETDPTASTLSGWFEDSKELKDFERISLINLSPLVETTSACVKRVMSLYGVQIDEWQAIFAETLRATITSYGPENTRIICAWGKAPELDLPEIIKKFSDEILVEEIIDSTFVQRLKYKKRTLPEPSYPPHPLWTLSLSDGNSRIPYFKQDR